MVPGLLLWVVWISLLLGSSVHTDVTQYRQIHDRMNLVEAKDFTDSLSYDEGELSDKQSKVVNKEYKKSSVTQPLKLYSVDQTLVDKHHGNVERIVNGASRRWESNNFEPITFPLKPVSQMDQFQPKPVYESQLTPSVVYGNGRPVQSTHLGVSPSNVESWQLVLPSSEGAGEPVTGPFYQQQNSVSSESAGDSTKAASPGVLGFPDNDPFSYEGSNMVEFSTGKIPTQKQPSLQYPPAIPKDSQSESWTQPEWFGQGNEIDSSFDFNLPIWDPFKGQVPSYYPSWHEFPYAWGYQPDISIGYKNVLTPRPRSLPAKAPEPPRVLPPRQRFIVQSKNGYQRRRLVKSKTTYTPDYIVPKGKYGKRVSL
ncbi:uncharacterized protein LOC124862967 [Girardinichthys multiradiatus]|uniref:uncharacterized protein LOC124862967 n=1 Tax=Girardinichthys multiradiatus TaxID=208333 RepID=UPI001FABB184|nr:uncharacterized protein LOC124862967 [Girardinichthys multiradiatus]